MYVQFPWQNRTGVAKAIAIVASVGVVAFGLCSANLLVNPSNNEHMQLMQSYFAGACSFTVIGSVVVLTVLFIVRAFQKPKA